MPKTKTKNQPAAIDPVAIAQQAQPEPEQPAASQSQPPQREETPPVDPPRGDVGLIEFPMDSCIAGYATTYVHFSSTRRQAAAAKVLWSSLSKAGARASGTRTSHPEGKVVDGVNDAVRWLLDRIADQIEADGKDLITDFHLEF